MDRRRQMDSSGGVDMTVWGGAGFCCWRQGRRRWPGLACCVVRRNLHEAPTQVASTAGPGGYSCGATRGWQSQPATHARPGLTTALKRANRHAPWRQLSRLRSRRWRRRSRRRPRRICRMHYFRMPPARHIATADDAPVIMVPRSHWTKREAQPRAISCSWAALRKITVHHTGFATPWETDTWNPTKEEIETIRAFHAGSGATDRHWADIAYHFIVDRAGRVWQARPLSPIGGLRARGAQCAQHRHCAAGEFRSAARECGAVDLVMCVCRVPAEDIPHQGGGSAYACGELGKTDCPGKSLAAFVARTRAELIAAEGA